jgi:hypothetical protein
MIKCVCKHCKHIHVHKLKYKLIFVIPLGTLMNDSIVEYCQFIHITLSLSEMVTNESAIPFNHLSSNMQHYLFRSHGQWKLMI